MLIQPGIVGLQYLVRQLVANELQSIAAAIAAADVVAEAALAVQSRPGRDGEDGEDGLPGRAGDAGAQGERGQRGQRGLDGEDADEPPIDRITKDVGNIAGLGTAALRNMGFGAADLIDVGTLVATFEPLGTVATHAAAADPHTGYQKESEKSAASGYASLDGTTKVPTAELGSGTANSTTFLRGDRTWAAPTASATTLEKDLGSTATWRGSFVITDAAISGTSKVFVFQAPGPYTGKGTRADEDEMVMLQCIATPGSGVATVRWQTLPMVTSSRPAQLLITTAKQNDMDLPIPTQRINKVRGNVKFSYQVLV